MLELDGLTARFGTVIAVDGVSLKVPEGEIVSLLGPSGSGKTTLLRLVAGLEPPTAGRVLWDGVDITAVAPHARGFGLMFQDFALFPHRDVGANVAFGLRMAGRGQDAIRARVAEVLGIVGLAGFEHRAVTTLSGGEQQRVALARALAPEPRLLMLDEPMGSLDRALRERLPSELRAIFQALGLSVLYVTHDQEEAFSVADRTVVLHGGRVEADGSPEEVWMRPPTPFVARFLGFRNVAEADVRDGIAGTPWGRIRVPQGSGAGGVTVVLRPGSLRLAEDGPMRGKVSARRFRGDHVLLTVAIEGAPPLELEAQGSSIPAVGDVVSVDVDPEDVLFIEGTQEGR